MLSELPRDLREVSLVQRAKASMAITASIDAIPLGATGKMQKMKLREQLKDYRLPTA
jgi:hypothetical protein